MKKALSISVSLLSLCLLLGCGGSTQSQTHNLPPPQGSFTGTGSMSTGRLVPAAALLQNGKVLVAGGNVLDSVENFITNTAEVYDPSSGQFSAVGNMEVDRAGATATTLQTGKVLLTGGESSNVPELYDPASGTFSATGTMSTWRGGHAAVLLNNGKVLVAGGVGNTGTLASAELYDPASGTYLGYDGLRHPCP